jgi:hypothetical protein
MLDEVLSFSSAPVALHCVICGRICEAGYFRDAPKMFVAQATFCLKMHL